MEEIFLILKGKARVRIGEATAEIKSQEAVVIPPREVHEMENVGEEELEYLAIGISQGRGGKTVLA
jgi:mannose-6-phosphate isomerase-like protein (cupin superfamily)